VNGLSGEGQLLFAGFVTLGVIAFYGVQALWRRFHQADKTVSDVDGHLPYEAMDDDPVGNYKAAVAASAGLGD